MWFFLKVQQVSHELLVPPVASLIAAQKTETDTTTRSVAVVYALAVLLGPNNPYLGPRASENCYEAHLSCSWRRYFVASLAGALCASRSRILVSTLSRRGSTVVDDVILRRRTKPQHT